MYITRDDVLLGLAKMELVQLTNGDPYGSEPDLAVLDRAIEYACELADGYLMGRYDCRSTLRPACCATSAPISRGIGCTAAASTWQIFRSEQPTAMRLRFWSKST